jgi:hypothetical protein
MKTIRKKLRSSIVGLVLSLAPHAAIADAVTDWNAIMQSTVAGSNVFFQTRNAAITQLAVFEAVNAIGGAYQPYLGTIVAPSGASAEAAAIAAAHRALSVLYPVASLDAQRAASLLNVPDGPAKQSGIAVGIAAANAMLALRGNDGSSTPAAYTPGTNPGDWQPTPPANASAVLPGWGLVQTFGINHGAQFRVSPPPLLGTGKYARDWDEVREVGRVNSSSRPSDRTDVANVYFVLTVVNLYSPIARHLSSVQGKTLSENARIFALLAMAGADALISSMESKFHYNFWRPVTAIRAGDLDGNAKTYSDPTWASLIATPPYPGYPSNHASLAGASLAVLQDVFGNSGHNITLSAVGGVVLKYNVLATIADDIDDARVFGGIHFRFDQEAGSKLGREVGHHILQHELRARQPNQSRP